VLYGVARSPDAALIPPQLLKAASLD
jgi:hypothetical protein